MLTGIALVLGAVAIVTTALSLSRHRAWWVRMWDFPRAQVFVVGLVALGLWIAAGRAATGLGALLTGVLALALVVQATAIWRYTPLAPREVQGSRLAERGATLSLVVSNVLESNRDADRLVAVTRAADADVMLFVEADPWWQARLDAAFATSHPEGARCAIPNTYGMLLYSRLPLEGLQVEYLVQPDIPSMQAQAVLASGARVWLNAVHPRPPAPGESDDSLERDAELLVVGHRIRDGFESAGSRPVVVFGDLNDVAWSRTTRLFQKVSRLLDPRKGRGLFPTFHARWPGLRWPLDHVFFSDDFRLVTMRRLDYVGSDHFPVYVCLSHEPPAAEQQEAPDADHADLQEAHETLREAERDPDIAATDLTDR